MAISIATTDITAQTIAGLFVMQVACWHAAPHILQSDPASFDAFRQWIDRYESRRDTTKVSKHQCTNKGLIQIRQHFYENEIFYESERYTIQVSKHQCTNKGLIQIHQHFYENEIFYESERYFSKYRCTNTGLIQIRQHFYENEIFYESERYTIEVSKHGCTNTGLIQIHQHFYENEIFYESKRYMIEVSKHGCTNIGLIQIRPCSIVRVGSKNDHCEIAIRSTMIGCFVYFAVVVKYVITYAIVLARGSY
uniref:Uncharacterized protein n=1 Tax=Romanomermis culicivorax TaxID=13658 RepID=A0A915IKT7_ROMCU